MQIKNKSHSPALLLLVLGLLLSILTGFTLYQSLEKREKQDIAQTSTIYTERTESLINSIFHKTDVLAATVKLNNGDISEETFQTVAHLVYEENAGIRGIQYMPKAVVTYSYPIEGNEEVIGKDFMQIPERKKDVMLAINTKSIALSGPYELIQGGLGVVARNPVFLNDAQGNEYFWGFSAIILNLPDALNGAQLEHLNDAGYEYQLYSINENGERIVISGNPDLNTDNATNSFVQVPNHQWTLSLVYKKSWTPAAYGIGTALIGIIIVITLWNIYRLIRREQDAIASKDRFFSNISHDMRTPLNAVLGFTRIAQSDTLTVKEKDQYLAKIESSGNLLLELVNDTLMLSKKNHGKLQLHPTLNSLYTMIDTLVNSSNELAQQKGIELKLDTSRCENATVSVDELYFTKILLNLITNAIKYTPEHGHVWLTFRSQRPTLDNLLLTVSVKDDGIGMSQKFQERMYEPFVQENQTGYESSGTGLGLAIVKQTVELMHGTIQVSSQLGKGTEFIIHLTLPVTTVVKPVVVAQSAAAADLFAGKKILVCEDNTLNREIAETILASQKMEVISAENGQICVDLFEESAVNEFDLILMDIRMPVMDGLEASRAIRKLDRPDAHTVPIIAMTADVFTNDVKECMKAGMNDHISKPVNQEVLFQTLAKHLRQ